MEGSLNPNMLKFKTLKHTVCPFLCNFLDETTLLLNPHPGEAQYSQSADHLAIQPLL